MDSTNLISVDEAQRRLLALAPPLPADPVVLAKAAGRYLAEDIIAKRSQPAADLSAMDGYAIRFSDLPGPFIQIGESAAGSPFTGFAGLGETVRIFTGAHMPKGTDTVLVQEDALVDGLSIRLTGAGPEFAAKHVRLKGGDFWQGDLLLPRGELLSSGCIAAAAMAGYGEVAVARMPRVKIIATGNELRPPGEPCDDAHLPSSNNIMLEAMLRSSPCSVVDFGIVPDDIAAISDAFADAAGFDIIVSSGGASVGDHDLVQTALKECGADIDFWRVALRPGKPMMAGRIGRTIMLGLPGNPSSAFVTAHVFLLPLVRHLAGARAPIAPMELAPTAVDIGPGDGRAEFMRARLENGVIRPFRRQDSGMVVPLTQANALLFRPAGCPAASIGDVLPYLVI